MPLRIVTYTIKVTPLGKPRMTQRDQWKTRACVLRYRDFCDKLRGDLGLKGKLKTAPVRVDWVAYFPIPETVSALTRANMAGRPHQAKPDRDNVDKGILDALFADDSSAASGMIEKRWDDGNGPRIVLKLYWQQ